MSDCVRSAETSTFIATRNSAGSIDLALRSGQSAVRNMTRWISIRRRYMRLTKYDKVLQKLLSYFWLLILEAEDLTRFSTSQFASPRRGTGTFYHARCVLIPSCTNQTLNLYKSDNNDAICFRFQRQSRPRVLAKVGRAGLLAEQVDIHTGCPKKSD